MTDHTELKRLAESLPQLPWSYEANGFILAWDGTERSRCENVGGFYYVCEGVSNFREYLLALEPAKVLALIAENEELGRYLCTCRDCGGEGALHTGDWHSYGHMEPPEPVMEKCGECDGTGLLGEIQDLYQVITERDQLKADNERLRADYAGLARFNPEWDRVAAAQDLVREHMAMVVQLKAEVAGLRTGYEAYEQINAGLKAEVEALRSGMKGDYDLDAWLDWTQEAEELRKDAEQWRALVGRAKSPVIGYTGCVICGAYTDHGGLPCPKTRAAANALAMENQRITPVEPLRVPHPLDAALGQGEQS